MNTEQKTCCRCNEPLEGWEEEWCERCKMEREQRIRVDANGNGFEYIIGLTDRAVCLVLDTAWADPEKTIEAFERAGVQAFVLTNVHAVGVTEGGPQFVSSRNGDFGTLRDANGSEPGMAICADLKTGWVGHVRFHGGRKMIEFRRHPAPMTFEPNERPVRRDLGA